MNASDTLVNGINAVTKADIDASIVTGTLNAVNRQRAGGKIRTSDSRRDIAAGYDFQKSVLSAHAPKGLVTDVTSGLEIGAPLDKTAFGAAVVSRTLDILNKG